MDGAETIENLTQLGPVRNCEPAFPWKGDKFSSGIFNCYFGKNFHLLIVTFNRGETAE